MADPVVGDGAGGAVREYVAAFRWQAAFCAKGASPFYGVLLSRCADDLEAGGPTRELLRDHLTVVEPALELRLMAAVHRAVLERRATALAMCWPSVGGHGSAEAAWLAMRELFVTDAEQLRADLLRPCQTNEPGRAAALLTALLWLAEHTGQNRLRLLEIGASAGLNLRVDQFRIGSHGPADSPCVIADAWPDGEPAMRPFTIVERRGCDVSPIDATGAEGRMALTSSIWADRSDRLERLRGALAIAATTPAAVDEQGAADWLRTQLAIPFDGLTVVWHSIVRVYVDPAEWADVEARLAAHPEVAHARLEADANRHDGIPVDVTWRSETTTVAVSEPHGPPVRLLV